MLSQETLNTMILTRLGRFRPAELLALYRQAGSASRIIEHGKNIKEVFPQVSTQLVRALKDTELVRQRCEKEAEFIEKNNIKVLVWGEEDYPCRLKECPDAPLILYYRGTARLNSPRCINIVGTRHITPYGQDLIRSFIKELKKLCPDVLIFSGLAYGVDIHAHRLALENNFNTIGVLAHGLDMIYPRAHEETAKEMLNRGGILSEYMSATQPVAHHFVQRNRIVAGCSDATVLVESASKGGGLITCGIARSYFRDVFAFPGAVGADYSEGCNNLIRDNGAALITSATDLVKAMDWDYMHKRQHLSAKDAEPDLFLQLSANEEAVVTALNRQNDLQINMLSTQTGLPIASLTALLFEMEMKGIVKPIAGGCYHLTMR